jgi:hypothetical protein
MTVIGTASGDGATIQISAIDEGDGLKFTIEVIDGYADLRGFFFDYTGGDLALAGSGTAFDSDGSPLANAVTASSLNGDDITKVGSNDNNMNGTGETFDAGLMFGASGGMTAKGVNDDVQMIEFTISGLTFDDLGTIGEADGLWFGIRALSVGSTEESREDSVKLLGTFDLTNIEDGTVG